MPVPTAPTYSTAALVAAHTSFRDLIDGGAGAGFIRIRDASDVLLAQIPLDDPCGTVSGTTGRLTFAINGTDDALAESEAAYGEFCESDGTVHLALPAASGVSAVTGYIVLNALVFAVGAQVSVTSAVIG